MSLGERIKACRQKAGLSQEKVAELVGVSRQAVTKWEADRSAPSTENLFRLAEVLGTSMDILLDTEEKHNQNIAEQVYSLYRKAEEHRLEERRLAQRKRLRDALLAVGIYLAVYLIGRMIWCDRTETSVLGWLWFARPSGEHSYLYGWLLSSNWFWIAMAISVLLALLGKGNAAFFSCGGFVLGMVLGIFFGPYPAGIPYGHGHYGWAIWGVVYLLSFPLAGVYGLIQKHRGE